MLPPSNRVVLSSGCGARHPQRLQQRKGTDSCRVQLHKISSLGSGKALRQTGARDGARDGVSHSARTGFYSARFGQVFEADA